MEITAKLVAELRRRCGLPMMKCKQALVEADGDIETATENLRKAGAKTIDKLKDRALKEGLVFENATGHGSAAVAVLCETDFVARSEDFLAFGRALVEALFDHAPSAFGDGSDLAGFPMPDGRTVQEQLDELVGGRIRENMRVGAWACFKPDEGQVATYLHHNQKIAALVELAGEGLKDTGAVSELAHDLGMQIAFHAGVMALDESGLDEAWVAKEREIFSAQVEKLPEEKRAMIAAGKLKKRLKEVVLLDQPFLKNEKVSVRDHVKAVADRIGTSIEIRRFARIAAGA